jgi:hypothetical protein
MAMQSQRSAEKISDLEHLSALTRLYPQIPIQTTPTKSTSRRVHEHTVAMAATMSLSASHNTTPPPQFTPLEQELLAEYQKLVTNMNTVLSRFHWFSGTRR